MAGAVQLFSERHDMLISAPARLPYRKKSGAGEFSPGGYAPVPCACPRRRRQEGVKFLNLQVPMDGDGCA